VAKKQPSTEKKSKPAAKSAAKPVKKAAPKSAPESAQSLFGDAADEPKPAKAAPKKSAPAAPARPLTVEEIGHAAGEVWGALSTGNGGVSLAVLKKSVDAPADLVLLALGWLAREDKVEIDASAKTPTVSLK
jgi:outer membrane biosynthesis protein TonB